MDIEEEHKRLLMDIGLREEDLLLLDGESVSYEVDEKRGVRLYDPYGKTSYREFIDIDGWSAWSSEGDTFLADILRETTPEVMRRQQIAESPDEGEIAMALKKRFGKKGGKASETP